MMFSMFQYSVTIIVLDFEVSERESVLIFTHWDDKCELEVQLISSFLPISSFLSPFSLLEIHA